MANIIRSAKSGSDWTENDLEAYNIQVRLEDAATFFGKDNLPLLAEEILSVQEAEDMSSNRNVELVNLLDLAMKPARRIRHAQTDVCLIDRSRNDILLLVQEDKRFNPTESRNPRPQLIAKAIAAFSYNSSLRMAAGEGTIESKTIPGVVLVGTTPTFYKIPITAALVRNIRHGTYPPEPTIVSAHVPVLPRPNRRYSEGMKPLDSRQAILRCYEAFKDIVGI
ncbi:hypothetical protein NEOLEDRAFT_1165115 [Neolentinus lepideus HHB14362 ss-1]|uniref:Uncharacterized protein n=1 Tax=Neolentinus lepideus HHB14362 ss-1 TaxID=1314782 RepID=A0A165NY81_9AGAM|nr:hypothetical protein NEOLEDRAFT_1165115 [Neolentinus lepideus HHB14362 ss-1]